MAIIVMKFGGTSVATPEKIRSAAQRAIDAKKKGYQVIMVVSAMGHETDRLEELAKAVCRGDEPSKR
ncbi:MAG: aspartate kinase, partial [Planctomycetaceae bacterium]|nr:aspartate kinase [Planctomycetaceae bacterium]